MNQLKRRLAFVVSHPIQYYAPLYQRLARRSDLAVKVFYTWHAAEAAVMDRGFKLPVTWDIPLTAGYDFELVPNVASDPGTHHFLGLRNPSLVERVTAWYPDVVHITGWAWLSHLVALRAFSKMGIPTLFWGDSHLLDAQTRGMHWWLKRTLLKRIFAWPTGFLVAGAANQAYYKAFGVEARRLFLCPHCIDVGRFAGSNDLFEREAARWRRELQISNDRCVLLYAGKFEPKKRPLELMRAVRALANSDLVLVMVGSGELDREVKAFAASDPERFRVLSFQNQSRMPVVYRLGHLFVLPSAFGETWGLAVNEALACGRPVLVSDRVGCAADVIDSSCGRVFSWDDPHALRLALTEMSKDRMKLMRLGRKALERAWSFDVACTEEALIGSLTRIVAR
jgi:glycosyltransferase involved in cell wall biosynthesis